MSHKKVTISDIVSYGLVSSFFCHCRFFTHQVLVFVEHVQLIGRKLPSPVEEIVHRVVPGLRPQVRVLHVRQDPVVRLDRVFQLVSKYRRDFVSYCINSIMNIPS